MKAYTKPLLFLFPLFLIIGFLYWKGRNEASLQTDAPMAVSDGIKSLNLDKLVDWRGNEILFSKLSKANIVIHFWASWCEPCVHEFPDLIEMTNRQGGKTVVLAIAEDKDLKEVEAFVKSFPQALEAPNFYIIWDQDRNLMTQWNVQKLPESYIYSPDRQLAKRVSGAVSWTTDDAISFFNLINQQVKK